MRFGDEVLQVTFPTSAEVGEEQQLVRPRKPAPSGEMNRPQFTKKSWPADVGRDLHNDPKHNSKDQITNISRLHDRDAEEVILLGLVFATHDFRQSNGIGS